MMRSKWLCGNGAYGLAPFRKVAPVSSGWVLAVLLTVSLWASGCSRQGSLSATHGVLYSVEYREGDGSVHGFTRVNRAAAVPGGNGSWNVDAYGQLNRDFLLVTRPQRPDLGPQIIPTRNLVQVQFGDGGIKQVIENQPASGG